MAEEVFTIRIYSTYISRINIFWKSAPHLFQEEVRMIVKTSMHTPDIIITNGTDMKVNFKFYDEVMQCNVMKENFVYLPGFRSNDLTIIITNVITLWEES